MTNIIDARGLNCPEPVILTKKAMQGGKETSLITIVDTVVAMENVSKLAKNEGYNVEVKDENNSYYIYMNKAKEVFENIKQDEDLAILITSNLFGKGEQELGEVLMKSFLYSLKEIEYNLTHIIFMNSGVLLTTEGSAVIENLKFLEANGTEIISCGTCLDYYGLKDSLQVGKVTNMYSAIEILTKASKNITI